jgi:hypothetical protein
MMPMAPIGPDGLFHLDILPPRHGILCQMMFDGGGHPVVKFRAAKIRRLLPNRLYPWTGWFHYDGEPIELQWQMLTSLEHGPGHDDEYIPPSDEVDEWIDQKLQEE